MTAPEIKAWFSKCVETNLDALYGTALRLTRSRADAEDLVAETVTKAWAAIDSLEDRGRFRPWVFRILHNCFIGDCRKQSVRPREVTFTEPGEAEERYEVCNLLLDQPDEFLKWWANPERSFFNSLLGEQIRAAIDRLPEVFRITVLLINVDGLGYDETAAVLGISNGTVRSRMKRGRTLLQKALWEQARDAGLQAAGQGNQT